MFLVQTEKGIVNVLFTTAENIEYYSKMWYCFINRYDLVQTGLNQVIRCIWNLKNQNSAKAEEEENT